MTDRFLPSATWQGPKEGYYFGTNERGTGYYRDDDGGATAHDETTASSRSTPPRKRARIAEELNEVRTIPNRLLEQAEQEAANTRVIDLSERGIRAAATALRKAFDRNELQRAEYAEEPDRYMESEVSLYENISALKAIAADVRLYQVVVESTELLALLGQLLLHENDDIVCSVVSVLLEWLDSSLVEDEEGNLVPEVLGLASVVVKDVSELLLTSLTRLCQQQNDEEGEDEVGKGSEDILSLLENLFEMDIVAQSQDESIVEGSSVAAKLVRETTMLAWLFQQVETSSKLSDRSLEILALIAPREDVHSIVVDWGKIPTNKPPGSKADVIPVEEKKNGEETIDGVEILLQSVASFRKKQPSDEQVESLENACIVLASVLTFSAESVQAFLDAQGIELVVRCLKERVHAGGVSLKWLDFTGNDVAYRRACERLVDAGTLKYLFPLLMGRHLPKPITTGKKDKKEWAASIESTVIRILYALTRLLTDDSPNEAKQRLVAKFVDEDKCDRLVELLLKYDQKARLAEFKFFRSDVEESLPEEAVQLAALNAKLSGGGEILHRLAAIVAFGCVGSKRCHERILSQLHLQQSGISLVRDTLQEFASVLDDGAQKDQLLAYLEKV